MIALCIGLVLLNVFQCIFWANLTQRLVNKLMSRNYAEYEQAQVKPEQRQPIVKDLEAVAEENDVLNELNAMVGH